MKMTAQYRGIWIGLILGAIFAAIFALFILPFFGLFDVSAATGSGFLDWWGETNMESALFWRAKDKTIPNDAKAADGLAHYRSSCIVCHGAPDISADGWATHMRPEPPELWDPETQSMNDGDIYYIVRNGLRMTGMPAFGADHSEHDIWNIVAFVRHLNQLTEEDKQQLRTQNGQGH